MRTKVLIAITKSNFGGAQRYVFDLARSLPKSSFDVSVACGRTLESPLIGKLHNEHIRVITLRHLTKEVSFLGDIRSFFDFYQVLRREQPDIVHLNSSKIGGIGALAARILGIRKIVFTAHGWEFNAPRPPWQRWIIYAFSTAIVLLAHRTIAVSDAARRAIGLSAARARILVAYNGLPSVQYRDRKEARRLIAESARIKLDGSEPWIVTIAELHPVKGLRYGVKAMAEAMKRIPNAHYFVIGEGSDRKNLERLITDHKLSTSVHLLGFIDNASAILTAFDIFLFPSLSEALPYVVLEAGGAGLPVIASRVGGIPEIIEDGISGLLVPAKDSGALAEALGSLLSDPRRRAKLGGALQRLVQTRFSLNRMVDETLKVYGAAPAPA